MTQHFRLPSMPRSISKCTKLGGQRRRLLDHGWLLLSDVWAFPVCRCAHLLESVCIVNPPVSTLSSKKPLISLFNDPEPLNSCDGTLYSWIQTNQNLNTEYNLPHAFRNFYKSLSKLGAYICVCVCVFHWTDQLCTHTHWNIKAHTSTLSLSVEWF